MSSSTPLADVRLAIYVGATNTDAVTMDAEDRLLAKVKVAATADPREAVAGALRGLLGHEGTSPAGVSRVMVSTGLGAVLVGGREALRRVAVLRIGGPLTHAIPPLFGWPTPLRTALSAGEAIVVGGAEYDGREAAPLDERAAARFLTSNAERVQSVAITAVFSPVAAEQELAAAALVRRELGDEVHVSVSHEIGTVGLVERENATVINAALVDAARGLGAELARILDGVGVDAELFFAQNDGGLMAISHALRYPALMLDGGPASSLRGASFLSGYEAAVVLDAGGRRTDVGALVNGAPQDSARPLEVAGVRAGLRSPAVRSLGLGGESLVHADEKPVRVGPEVRNRDDAERRSGGGAGPIALIDAAAAGGRTPAGRRSIPRADRPALAVALRFYDDLLAEAVDEAAGGMATPPIVAVGGAAALVPDHLAGAEVVLRPRDGEVAGAVGAAVAPVSGAADRIAPNRPEHRRRAIEEARAAAFEQAIDAGADPAHVRLVELTEVPLANLADAAIRIHVKAAGPSA